MRIEAVELRQLAMPLRFPIQFPYGREEHKICLLVRIFSDGAEGWGEVSAATAPFYNEETVGTAWHILESFIVPALLGRRLSHPREFPALVQGIRRHHMAKAGVEAALWDLYAQAQGQSLRAAIGGRRDRVPVGVMVGIESTVEKLIDRIGGFLSSGYRRIKIKIQPGWDVAVVERIRHVLGGIPLQVDSNAAYTLADAAVFRELDRYDLLLIEQPLEVDDLTDHAILQRDLKTPICLDESITSPSLARKALDIGACRVVNIKQARLGGLTAAIQVHDVCQSRGVPVWCGGLLETGVGRALVLALASLPNFTLPGDTSASDRYFEEDLVNAPARLGSDGTIGVPDGPGLGVTVRSDRLEAWTTRRAFLQP